MKIKTIILFNCILIFFYSYIFGQNTHTYFYKTLPNTDTAVNSLNFRNIGFVKNVEAFSKFLKGYTMPGNNLTTVYNIGISDNLIFKFGLNWIYFYGDNDSTIINPLISLNWKINKKTNVILGSLPKRINLSLPDFLLHNEFFIKSKPSEGIALTFETKKLYVYTWFESETYIFQGSLHPEYLFGASVLKWKFVEKPSSISSFNFAFTIGHCGGQINKIKKPVETTANIALDFTQTFNFNSKNNLSGSVGVSFANKTTDIEIFYYKKGYAIYSILDAKIFENYLVNAMFFYGNRWFSYKGNPIYKNITNSKRVAYANRAVTTLACMKRFNINKNVKAAFGGYVLYELYENEFIHGLSFQLGFDFGYKPPRLKLLR